MSLAAARQAIASEIKNLKAQQSRLLAVLKQIGGQSTQDVPEQGKRLGRPKGSKNRTTRKTDIDAVLKLIARSGKINAVSFGHQLRKAGLAKIPTAQLVEAGVNVTGTKGSTTYSYAG